MRWPWRRRSAPLTLEELLFPHEPSYASPSAAVTPERALGLSTVWACVRLLSDTVSTLPVDVYREGSRDPLPTPRLLQTPAAGWALPDWLYATMVSLLLRGNAYGLITARAGAAMRPAQVELVDPALMAVTVTPEGRVEYRYRGNEVDRDDLWHVRAFVYPGRPTGLSPVEHARQSIGLGLASVRFGNTFYEEGAAPTGLLSSDQDITKEQADGAKEKLVRATRGKREPLVLGRGITWQQLAVSPTDAQWVEQQRYGVTDVARIFGVPPELVGGESGGSLTYATVEGRALDFLRYGVNPWLVRLEQALGQLLPRGQHVKFNVDAMLRSTTKERYDAHKVALDAGFLTVNEVRDLEDLPPLAQPAPRLSSVEGGAVA